ncbi:hypothetical protein [Micromonospora sp. NPDC047730]|uniref:hypothetical protein n=1 Tax=Micromonospora sp. NPDC047730 TaxID=3364253 RepID=UPI003719F164
MAEQKPDAHLDPKVGARAPRELQNEVRAILAAREKTLSAAIVALLRALRRDPDRTLAMLEADWPPEKRGRPRLDQQSFPE